MSTTSADVVIVGCGVMGSAIAYHLTKRGIKVHMLERARIAVSPVASWASAGGVRRQGRHPAEARLASEAIARWPSLEDELEADLHYRQGGNLLLAETEGEAARLVSFVQEQRIVGFGDVRLLERREVLELVPGLNKRVVAGSYAPLDGQADPARTTRAFASAAVRHGAICWEETLVLSLLRENERICGVQTPKGDIQAEQVVLAAGTWSDELLAGVGLQLPMRTQALQMLLSTPAPQRVLQPVLSALGRQLSLKQLPDGSFLLGGGWPGDPAPDRRSFSMRQKSVQGNWQTACELLPLLGQQHLAQGWCGLEAVSVDEIPFIGSVSGLEGLTLALGFSGHGFALAPAVGRSVADQICGQPTPELDGLRPDRIANFSREQVQSFLAGRTTYQAG